MRSWKQLRRSYAAQRQNHYGNDLTIIKYNQQHYYLGLEAGLICGVGLSFYLLIYNKFPPLTPCS